jgi:hypothetical protein
MDDNQKSQVIEQAKNLALTISFLNSKYDKVIGEFNSKLAEVYLQLKNDVNTSNDNLELIAKNVAYQSNLDETRLELNEHVKDIQRSLQEYATIHDHPYSLDSHEHDTQYSNIDHTHDYVSTDAYLDYAKTTDGKLDVIRDFTLTSVQSICVLIEDRYNNLIKQVQNTNSELDKLTDDLAKNIDDVEYKLDAFKSNTKKDINVLTIVIDSVKNTLNRNLVKSFDDINTKFEDKIDDVVEFFTLLESDINTKLKGINKELDNKSDINHNHDDDYAELNHNHDDDYADIDHTHMDILTSIDVIQTKHESLENSISDAFNRLKDKPEYSEILLKTDLDKLKQEIIDAVPVPKNGKDAEDWEFKPHPTRKGVLIFKKHSHKNWNYIDLNHIIPKPQEYENYNQGGILGGGGGASSSGMSVLKNGVLAGFTNIVNFIGTGVTSITDADNVTTIRIDAGTGGGSSRLNLTTAEMISMASTLNTTDEGLSVWNTTEKLSYNWTGTEFLQDGEAPVKTIRMDDVSSTVSYIGEATVNSLENVAVWRIKKLVTVGDVTSILWADGVSTYTKNWSNHLTYNYS